MSMKNNVFKRCLSMVMTVLMVLSCWVWFEPAETVNAANLTGDSNYLFAYFTGTSIEGQTIHLAVSQDGLNYTALRNNEPVIVPSKGTGCVRDPYIWYNEQDNYYYILATDLDFTDTGSDYSDNSESFIIWRSKDLVHWYDETMIDVKAMSHLIGDTENMQAVWAPQVLWDGTSYVVYFSLQCEATKTPWGWNNLQIVYLRTTDLLDQSAYYEYGVIHDPERHVIDADIIKKPGTEQYYMFYKDESASGGIQSIYYMISDNGPTGPYYAPGNANDGRGPQLFAEVGKNIEGCNSFFDDNGNLITYVDEYDYTNAAGQKEAHFHVSSTSDFTNYTKLPESSYNINSLSPRHGSVVKITDDEYNRLLNNAYGITSSSFPASETLEDHLVGRYFTTRDYTYNAANNKNDLTLTDGTIITGQEATGEWFAGFQSAGAEIDLNALIPGDLNIKDGFTITFTALVPSSTTGANTRFFDISNNWSQRTDASECYLHMSPIADSNGLYVGAFNGPVTTTSWTWASQGKNFNDDQKHEYIISFADGNMIMYIDGELAMKRDRFNMNMEYGDNFLDDNWYKQIGNSKMRIGKSEWSDPLLNAYLQDFCIYDCSMSYYDVKTIQNEQDIEAGLGNKPDAFSSFGSVVPSWEYSNTISTDNYANVLYSPQVYDAVCDADQDGKDQSPMRYPNAAALVGQTRSDGVHFGVYYASATVLYVDGKNTPKMPVMKAARIEENGDKSYFVSVYPTGVNDELYLNAYWKGYTSDTNYAQNMLTGSNGGGYSSSTTGNGSISSTSGMSGTKEKRKPTFYANTLLVSNNITFDSNLGYKVYKPNWQVNINDDGTNRNNTCASNYNIYVLNLAPFVSKYNEMLTEYDSIVENTSYCQATIANYKAVVEAMQGFNPHSYNYASGTEAAVKACYDQSQKLISDYDNAIANLGDCKKVTIPGRDATCAAPGLTQGSYCEFCGEVFEAQTVTTKLPHSFGTKFQEGDNWYVKCNVCGLKLLVKENEVRYENMFSFNAWYDSDSKNPNSGTIVCDFTKDKITFTNGSSDGESVSGASGNVTRSYNLYSFAVKEGKSYYLEYTLTSKEASTDIFVFYYDKDGNHVGTYGGVVSSTNGTPGLYNYKFTPVAKAAYAELRFDSNVPGKTVEFANIGVYEEENYNNYAKNNPYSRLAFNTGESFELFTPKRIGYEFLGWYTSDGLKVENTNQLASSVTVYAKWREVGNAVLYNGNLFDLTEFAKTNDYKMQSSVLDGHVYADFANGTFNTISAREGLGKADLAVSSQLDTYNAYGNYKIPVTAGNDYVFTTTVASKTSNQVYIFFYNENGNAVTHPITNQGWVNHGQGTWYGNKLEISFTVPEGATRLSIRMGTTGQYAFTQTFSNIGLYTAEDYKVQGELTNCPTMTYVPNGTKVTLPTPLRDSYMFENWYTQPYGKGIKFTADSTATMKDSTFVYANWLVSDGILRESMLIVDFGMATKLNPFNSNEEFVTQLANTGKDYEITAVDTSSLTNGTVSFSGKEVTYTPTSVLSSIETFAYTVTVSGQTEKVTGTVIVLPATVVYYEDDADAGFVTYTNGKSSDNSKIGTWTTAGTSTLSSASKTIADDVYGYAEAYKNNNDTYSMGSAHYVSVSQKNNPQGKYNGVADDAGSWPFAEFTFAGTGFDVVSLISKDTGVVNVKVYKGDEQIHSWVVDTYYGYTLDSAGDWVVSDSNENVLYQIPVIGTTDLAYGTYRVEIIPTYSSRFDSQKDGSYDFYLDAIRVYNPMNDNYDAATVYMNDGEYVVAHQSIRDILIEEGGFGEGNGVVYINQNVQNGTFEQYSQVGPKNEVYLAKDQSIAFNMTVTGFKPTSVQVSAHALSGTASMRFGSDESYSGSGDITHKTTLYYKTPFTGAEYWNDNGDGTYTLNAPIVITNEGEGILSLCNIKVTSDASTANGTVMFMMTDDDFDTAVYSVNRMSGLTEDDGALFVPDDMTSGTDNEVVEKGEEVLVTINTSAEVHALTVNGEEATLVSVNEDGSKTWNYTFVTENRGEQTFTLVAYNSDGFASEEQTVTVNVQSRIEIFFNKLSLFFQMIIEFFNNLVG